MPPALQNPFLLWIVLSVALAVLCYFAIRKELRLRATLYGAFILACVVEAWPPYEQDGRPGKIHLGLDLKGGIHLVLQVVTDDALNATIDDAVGTARAQGTAKGISFGGARRVDATSFAVEGVEPARVKDMRDILKDFFRSPEWDVREQGAGKFLVKMTDAFVNQVRDRTVKEAIRTLERRVNQLGVAEPVIAQHGAKGDQILVQLPGVTDVEQAKRVISTTAQLALKLVEDNAGTRESLLEKTKGVVPDNMDVVQGQGREAGVPEFYLVRKEAVITGRDLKNARAGVGQNNEPDVQFTLNPGGAEKFKRETGRSVGKRLAIILDGSVASAPTIQSQIGSEGVVTGRFTTGEADELSTVLRAGALPASLKCQQELPVGASLGKDSIRSGIIASAAGVLFLTVFMLVYYRMSGLTRWWRWRPTSSSCSGPWPIPGPPSPCPASRGSSSPSAWVWTPTCWSSSASARSCATAGRCARPSPTASSGCGSPSSTPTPPRSSPRPSCSSSAPGPSRASRSPWSSVSSPTSSRPTSSAGSCSSGSWASVKS